MIQFHTLLAGCWVLFALLHSLMASLRWKNFLMQRMGHSYRYYRLLYSGFNFALLGLILWYQFSHASVQLFPGFVSQWAGFPLAAAGLWVMGVCIRKYFANLSGVDVFTKKSAPMVLETSGLHRYVRHPLYSGTLLFMWALFLIFPALANAIACVVSTVYVLIGISIEERKLVVEYGEGYVQYAKRTPRLIPLTGSW